MKRVLFVAWLALTGVLATCGSADAQRAATLWESKSPQKVDFATGKAENIAFSDDGTGYELELEFLMSQPKIEVIAALPSVGDFKLVSANEKAMIEIQNVRVNGLEGRGEVVSMLRTVSVRDLEDLAKAHVKELLAPEREKALAAAADMEDGEIKKYLKDQGSPIPEAAQELRPAYADAKATEMMADDFKDRLEKFAKDAPNWFDPKEDADLGKAPPRRLRRRYTELSQLRIGREYLEQFDFKFDPKGAKYDREILQRLEGAAIIIGGKAADRAQAKKAAELLGGAEVARLREALTVRLKCQFLPKLDPRDPNAQWFNGQRIACRASGVGAIRVEGHLDIQQADLVDWWILEKWNPANTELVLSDESKAGPLIWFGPYADERGARLGVKVKDGRAALDYWFEFRPKDKKSGAKVLIQETPSTDAPTFPY